MSRNKTSPAEKQGHKTNNDYITVEVGVRYLRIKDFCALMGERPSTVRARCAKGAIPGARKVGKGWRIPIRFEEANHEQASA